MDREQFSFDIGVTCGNEGLGIYAEKFKDLNCNIFRLPSKKKIFVYNKELKKILKKNHYDIIHVHQDEKSFQSLYCAKKCGVKVRIAHAHRCDIKKSFINKLLSYLTNKFSNCKMACSVDSAKCVFKTTENVFILNNAIDVNKFIYNESIRKDIRKELNIRDDEFVLGTIARIDEQKNPLFSIDIIKELTNKCSNLKYIYIGNGKMYDEVQQYISNSKLNNVCLLLGEKLDAYKYYNIFDLFLLPSLSEGFGISALEAQANGLLTVISNGFPQSVKINNDGVEFINLNKTPSEWADIVYDKIQNFNGKRFENQVAKSVYNIYSQVKLLENKYKEMI